MTPRFPAALLALAAALIPVSAYTLFVLSLPIFDWWWTPFSRALVFLLLVDVLLFLVAPPLLCGTLAWSALRKNKARAEIKKGSRHIAPVVCLSGLLLVAGAGTYVLTYPKCHQVMDQGDYYSSAGDQARAQECWTEARRLCIEDGHSPAH